MSIKFIEQQIEILRLMAEEVATSAELAEVLLEIALWERKLQSK
jgi:hypothetical protein